MTQALLLAQVATEAHDVVTFIYLNCDVPVEVPRQPHISALPAASVADLDPSVWQSIASPSSHDPSHLSQLSQRKTLAPSAHLYRLLADEGQRSVFHPQHQSHLRQRAHHFTLELTTQCPLDSSNVPSPVTAVTFEYRCVEDC